VLIWDDSYTVYYFKFDLSSFVQLREQSFAGLPLTGKVAKAKLAWLETDEVSPIPRFDDSGVSLLYQLDIVGKSLYNMTINTNEVIMKKVMFLCHGNICRSPIAEFVFKDMTRGMDIHVESAAVSREEIGNPIYPAAASILRKRGVPFSGHRARQITRADYDEFDYVIIMEEYNRPRLMRIIGRDDGGKVFRLRDFTNDPGDIEDPWYSGNFEPVFEQIEDSCRALLEHMKHKGEV